MVGQPVQHVALVSHEIGPVHTCIGPVVKISGATDSYCEQVAVWASRRCNDRALRAQVHIIVYLVEAIRFNANQHRVIVLWRAVVKILHERVDV